MMNCDSWPFVFLFICSRLWTSSGTLRIKLCCVSDSRLLLRLHCCLTQKALILKAQKNSSTRLVIIKMSLLLRKIVKVSQVAACQQTRKLNIQENISHSLLNEYGIKTPKFCVANSAVEAEKIACGLMTKNFMVKAQVLAGGRGLGTFKNGFKGGVHSATR